MLLPESTLNVILGVTIAAILQGLLYIIKYKIEGRRKQAQDQLDQLYGPLVRTLEQAAEICLDTKQKPYLMTKQKINNKTQHTRNYGEYEQLRKLIIEGYHYVGTPIVGEGLQHLLNPPVKPEDYKRIYENTVNEFNRLIETYYRPHKNSGIIIDIITAIIIIIVILNYITSG
jgi:hypothetical protein